MNARQGGAWGEAPPAGSAIPERTDSGTNRRRPLSQPGQIQHMPRQGPLAALSCAVPRRAGRCLNRAVTRRDTLRLGDDVREIDSWGIDCYTRRNIQDGGRAGTCLRLPCHARPATRPSPLCVCCLWNCRASGGVHPGAARSSLPLLLHWNGQREQPRQDGGKRHCQAAVETAASRSASFPARSGAGEPGLWALRLAAQAATAVSAGSSARCAADLWGLLGLRVRGH